MKPEFVIGGVAVIAVALIYFLKTTTGAAVGKQVGDSVVSFIGAVGGGAAGGVADLANDPDINPLHGVGSWLGGTVYDIFSPSAP